ncbi:MAG: type II secretion system F family protein, partial [Acidimicrobiales bacterium]
MTLAAVLALAVLAAGASAQAASRLSRRGTVVGRLSDRPPAPVARPAGAGGRAWRLAEPPPRVAAALADADLPLSAAQAWTAWLAALVLGPVAAALFGGPGLAGVTVLALVVAPPLFVRTRRGRADTRLERALPGALEAVARSLRSGASLRPAVEEARGAENPNHVPARAPSPSTNPTLP